MSTPSPEEARRLLEQAERSSATASAGASWPHIAGLLGLGGASSLALPALAYVPEEFVAIPLLLLFVWIGAIFAFSGVFSRSIKTGFGRRWVTTMTLWGVLWVVGVVGVSWIFPHQAWFVAVSAGALSVVTLGGAWLEARR